MGVSEIKNLISITPGANENGVLLNTLHRKSSAATTRAIAFFICVSCLVSLSNVYALVSLYPTRSAVFFSQATN